MTTTPTRRASQLQAVLARSPDLVGVFGANLLSAIGAADGVQEAGKTGEIQVVAFDAPQRIVDDIKSAWSTSRSPSGRPRSATTA